MRAVWVDAHGPPEVLVLRESEDPRPGEGEVLVAVGVSGVQFGETLLRSGARVGDSARKLAQLTPPFVPGTEVGGRIIDVGAGVSRDLVGRRMIGRTAGTGGYAELAVLAVDALIEVPEDVSLEVAVALLAQGRTALQVFREAHVEHGESVLVEAAAGGVGNLLVQLASNAGASPIIGAVGSAEKFAVVEQLGASVTVDYSAPGWEAVVREATSGRGVDVVFESVGGPIGVASFNCLAGGSGRLIAFGFSSQMPSPISMQDVVTMGVSLVGVGLPRAPALQGLKALTRDALQLAAAGSHTPLIGQRWPLDAASEAHAAIEQRRTNGKTLLLP
jgi:NADPH2:quinone reductase